MRDHANTNIEQSLFDNPAPRCPCLLLLDTSGSMQGRPITELNDAVGQFIAEVQGDDVAASSVELGIITFGGNVTQAQPFTSMAELDSMPHLVAEGSTPLGGAIELAITSLERRKEEYRRAGVSYYQPWVVIMSDGEPTDPAWAAQATRLKALAEQKKAVVLCVGIGEQANLNELARCSVMPPKMLAGLRFSEFFRWLSQSMQRVSASIPGDKIALPSTSGWDSIEI